MRRVETAVTACLEGFTAHPVDVQADISDGMPGVTIVGLTDRAIQESRERVRSAVRNSGFRFPSDRRVTLNLAPAEMRKEGTAFDLAIAVALLAATGMSLGLEGTAFVGELGLDGSVRPTRGVLPMCIRLARAGIRSIVVPAANAAEAEASGAPVVAVRTLGELVAHLDGSSRLSPRPSPARPAPALAGVDLADIQGQQLGKRAIEIAAAGGHHLLLSGPPGAGKTMLARSLVGLLPDLDEDAAREVSSIHSIAGLLDAPGLVRRPPLRSPHHSVSIAGLVGGSRASMPGELCLAHRGVLVLDELPEFQRHCLEALREPLEEGRIRIGRATGTRVLPAAFILAATANPCPCGRREGPTGGDCSCPAEVVSRYQKRVSGPLRDRVDLDIRVGRVPMEGWRERSAGPDSAEVAERVRLARTLQAKRQGAVLNVSLGAERLREVCGFEPGAARRVSGLAHSSQLTGRGFHGLLRLARTLADLEGRPGIGELNLLEAAELRGA